MLPQSPPKRAVTAHRTADRIARRTAADRAICARGKRPRWEPCNILRRLRGVRPKRTKEPRHLLLALLICAVALAGTSCGSKRQEAVHPLYPNYYGVAVGQQPALNGEFKEHRTQDVTLTFVDGRRILVPATAAYLPDWIEVCRTKSPQRADGSCRYPCQLQVGLATHDRAKWVRVFPSSAGCGHIGLSETTGPIASVTSHWLVTQDGTALPVPLNGKVDLACPFNPTPVDATELPHKFPRAMRLKITLDAHGSAHLVTCQPGFRG